MESCRNQVLAPEIELGRPEVEGSETLRSVSPALLKGTDTCLVNLVNSRSFNTCGASSPQLQRLCLCKPRAAPPDPPEASCRASEVAALNRGAYLGDCTDGWCPPDTRVSLDSTCPEGYTIDTYLSSASAAARAGSAVVTAKGATEPVLREVLEVAATSATPSVAAATEAVLREVLEVGAGEEQSEEVVDRPEGDDNVLVCKDGQWQGDWYGIWFSCKVRAMHVLVAAATPSCAF